MATVVVNGYYPSMSIKQVCEACPQWLLPGLFHRCTDANFLPHSFPPFPLSLLPQILNIISEDQLGYKGNFRSPLEQAEFIRDLLLGTTALAQGRPPVLSPCVHSSHLLALAPRRRGPGRGRTAHRAYHQQH